MIAKYLLTPEEMDYAHIQHIIVDQDTEDSYSSSSLSCLVQNAGLSLLWGGVLCTLGATLGACAVLIAMGTLCCSGALLWVLCGLACTSLVVGTVLVYEGSRNLSVPPTPLSEVQRLRAEAQKLRDNVKEYQRLIRVINYSFQESSAETERNTAKRIRDLLGCLNVSLHLSYEKDCEANQKERNNRRRPI